MTAAVAPAWVHSVKKVKAEIPKEKMVMLGVGAAFSFLAMMFNIPLPGGTTGHAVGGTLIALMLGPEAACISVTIALLVQALLFGDGGILAFGANCFNMAFVLPFTGYYIYKAIAGTLGADLPGAPKSKRMIAAGVGSYLGINAAALCAAIEFGIQPLLFKAADGTPLYCPYSLSVSIPAMMIGHLTIFGLAEVIFTVALYAFMDRTSQGDLYANNDTVSASKANLAAPLILIAVLIAATPLGLIASGTAWGEWEIDEIPTMTESISWSSLFPDYTVGGLPEWIGYILSAVIGVAVVIILFRIIGGTMKTQTDYDS